MQKSLHISIVFLLSFSQLKIIYNAHSFFEYTIEMR
jgi:hypothetical protein